MAQNPKPIRRVVTGNDAQGRSKVVWDGVASNATGPTTGTVRSWTDLWVWSETPILLSGDEDAGNLPYDFPGPPNGGHLRVIQAQGRQPDYDPAKDAKLVPPHPPMMRPAGRTWDRGGINAFSSSMHKTETVDYGVVLEGMRLMVLDDCEVEINQGDTFIQVGAWHQWVQPKTGIIAFDMIGARFLDGPAGLAQGNDPVLRPNPNQKLPEGVKPARRIVTIDREPGKSSLVSDGACPDVRVDLARPGYASQRMWVTDSAPAKIVYETLHLPHTIEPPARGTVLRVVTFPPDDVWHGKVGTKEVQAFFSMMGSSGASTYSPQAPHPYMQKTRTFDYCSVLEGEIVLVLDTQEVTMKAGDIALLRGANHAWSNRSTRPAVVEISSHDGTW